MRIIVEIVAKTDDWDQDPQFILDIIRDVIEKNVPLEWDFRVDNAFIAPIEPEEHEGLADDSSSEVQR